MENPFVWMTWRSPSCWEHNPSHTEAPIDPNSSTLPDGQSLWAADAVTTGTTALWEERSDDDCNEIHVQMELKKFCTEGFSLCV